MDLVAACWGGVGYRHRVLHTPPSPLADCIMSDTPKVKGPASYFPSIEKTYGKPIAHWMELLQRAGPRKHMELVSLLKTEHAIGHGHANALVAAFLSR